MAAVVLECEDTELVRQNAVLNGVWKSRHQITANVGLEHTPILWSLLNDANSNLHGIEKLDTKTRDSSLIKLRRLDQFSLSVRIENQSHPRARRADLITSS